MGIGRGHGLLHSSPHPAFGMWDLSMPTEAPASVPSAELVFPLPELGVSLYPSLQAWPRGHLWAL